MKDGEKQRTRHKPAEDTLVSVPAPMTAIKCPACGFAVELWSGDEETRCFACDHTIFRKQKVDC